MQLNFDGKPKDQVAIERIRQFCPPEGYYLAFSGGKDSVVLHDLSVRAEVKYDGHYHLTGADPPELVQFIRHNYPMVEWTRPERSIWRLIVESRGLPRRQSRWSCE